MTDKIQKKVEGLIRPEIRALKAYLVPDATGLIKLDAMENPYSWPEAVKREWVAALQQVALNRYPDPDARRLRERLRAALGVPAGMELMLGNGSDELIQIILMAVAKPGAVVLAPTPTFVMYEMISTFTGMKFTGVPLTCSRRRNPFFRRQCRPARKPSIGNASGSHRLSLGERSG